MKDRIKGSLLALAWGDILGCPVETWKKHEIQSVYHTYSDLPKEYPVDKIPPQKIRRLRPLGLYSDDTQQAMALINVCLNHRGWDKVAWKQMLVQGMSQQAWRGVGRNFVNAVQRMKKGVKIEESGSSSAGIGAAMRTGPLGALYSEDRHFEILLRTALESSLATHADQRAAVFAAVISYTVSHFVQGLPRETVLERIPHFARQAEFFVSTLKETGWKVENSESNLISNALAKAVHWVDDPVKKVRDQISELARPHLQQGFTRAHPNQGFVLLGGLHALLMACRDDMGPQEILLLIIQEGYDTDTVAAIAGTILGARFGTEWIPVDRFYDKQRIMGYAEALVQGQSPETMDAFLKYEATLTQIEKNFQACE